jgi:hypothetical protein
VADGGIRGDGTGRGLVVPRREFTDAVDGVAGGNADQGVAQIGEGLDPAQLARFDETCDQSPMLSTAVAAREEGILDCELLRTNRPFDGIAVHFDAAIGQEPAQAWPACQAGADGRGQAASAGDEVELLLEPGLEVVHQRPRAFLADAQPNRGGTAAQLGLDGIKLDIAAQGFGGDRRAGRLVDVVKISSGMHVTVSEHDAPIRIGQTVLEPRVIGPRAIAVEDTFEPSQVIDGVVMPPVLLVHISDGRRSFAGPGAFIASIGPELEHYPTKLDRQNRDSQRETDERVCFQA